MDTENKFKRYQLNKNSMFQVKAQHPWIFSKNLSTAAQAFSSGEWLKLYDGANQVVGYGILGVQEERIGIRIFHFGQTLRNRFFYKLLREAIQIREDYLANYRSAVRLLNGEADRVPGITADLYGNTVIIQYYSPSVYKLARLVSFLLPLVFRPDIHIQIRPAMRIGSSKEKLYPPRWTRGTPQSTTVIEEGGILYHIDLEQGQKGGFYLDLRGSREELSKMDLSQFRVLNLFSYTGAFSMIAAKNRAEKIVSVDQSSLALDGFRENLKLNSMSEKKHTIVHADVFEWVKKMNPEEKFDLIIFDPPCMASSMEQVPAALAKLEKLYTDVLSHLVKGGLFLACCCTARFSREDFVKAVGSASKSVFGKGKTKILKEISIQKDHRLLDSFPEGKYLKQILFSV